MAKKSKFDQWFTKQFGPRPSKLSLDLIYREAKSAEQQFNDLHTLFSQVERWEAARKSALYAWTAREAEDAKARA